MGITRNTKRRRIMALLELDDKVYKIPNKVMKAFEDMSDYINDLKEENKTLKELNVCVGCDNNPDYKSRIDKAIDYIIERYDYKGHALTHTFDKDNVRELLNILKGSEE
jgi:hypothetical protein